MTRIRFGFSWMVLAVCCVLAAGLFGCSSDEAAQRVQVIPRVDSLDMDYMLTDEVGVMLSMLSAPTTDTDDAGSRAVNYVRYCSVR